eukprot:TRINITY_DN1576_c0_g1_i1.p1 TRINITY_DN1576_c0_g1~~TRINITY_DN1576_c0_g1_i1.p1  ORF type:complete len:350 (-),score=70.53 TRINITY_DN1576_c0_g1_i1:40-1089(-)
MIRVRNRLTRATHSFFQDKGFYNIQTPIITGSDCEGAGEIFHVTTLFSPKQTDKNDENIKGPDFTKDFFKKPTFLTVSGQLNAETYACSMSNVYTFGPTFRAEESNTHRHLAEFWMIEPEVAFADLTEIMDLAEEFIHYLISDILCHCDDDLIYFEKIETIFSKSQKKENNRNWWNSNLRKRLESVVRRSFHRLSYDDAVEVLKKSKKKFNVDPDWGSDLNSEHETFLVEKFDDLPIMVYNYPKKVKPFYARVNDDQKTVAAFDLLVPGIGELIGGSQREERLHVLESRFRELNLDPSAYEWYIDLRRYGSVPHSGFGLGFERLVNFCTGLENIRDAIPFPRYVSHIDF